MRCDRLKTGKRNKAKLVKVYEKISKGIWSYKGFFELIDANIVSNGKRNLFKFSLKPVEKKSFGRVVELPHNRLIPTPVKVEVWRRDRGQCVLCGSTKNLHFDHDIPFSKGGSSVTAANVRLLCAKCNLQNGADGVSDIEGKIARVATREVGNERVSNQIRFCRSRRGFSPALRQRHTFRNCQADSLNKYRYFKLLELVVILWDTPRHHFHPLPFVLCCSGV
jgi:hypothetical protein